MVDVHYTYRRTSEGTTITEHASHERPAPDGSTFFTVFPEDDGYGIECNRCGGYVGWQETRARAAQVMWDHSPATCFDELYTEGTEEMQLLGVLADFSDTTKRGQARGASP